MFWRWSKSEWIHRMILLIFPLLIVLFLMSKHDIYGSVVDWQSQHIVFPDYFRLLFQKTGQLFPDFSMNLGAGQNFAQYTYYGMLRPDVIISFLLPFINMRNIIAIAGIIYVLLAVQLFYQWMKSKITSPWILLFSSCLFAFASPLIFHSHRHIMFISYFPGLLLCLIGTDQYLEKKKAGCLTLGVFLMIICSYFYSVGGLVVTGIYSIYAWLKRYPQGSWKAFFSYIIKYIGWLLLGVLLSAFYLVPTAFAMFLQVRPALSHPTIWELFSLKNGFSAILYDDYNIGLTAIGIFSLLYGFVKKEKASRILSCFLLLIICIPLCQYVLNGLQYVREKSLIPFLPLFVMMIGIMLQDWDKKRMQFPWWGILCFIQYFAIKSATLRNAFILDVAVILILLCVLRKTKWKKCIFIYLVIPAILCVKVNAAENFATFETINKINDKDRTELIRKTLDTYSGLYRFDDCSTTITANKVEDIRQLKTTQYSSNSNMDYNEFYYNVMKQPMLNRNHVIMSSANNPFFNGFMGVRFLFNQSKKQTNWYGYHTVLKKDTNFVQENPDVMPIAYVSYDIMGRQQFDQYAYPYTLEAIYMNTVVEEKIQEKTFTSSIQEIQPIFQLEEISDSLQINETEQGMRIKSNGKSTLKLRLDEPIENNKLFIVRCEIDDIEKGGTKDTDVSINGIRNKKAGSSGIYASPKADFEYVIGSEKGVKSLNFTFTDGTYTLKNFTFYVVDASFMKERKNSVTALNVKEKADTILSGDVTASDDGYFVTTIPYQEGLQIFIDGKKVGAEKVNTAFLGAKISKGTHEIDVYYTMPGKALGRYLSIGALLCIIGIWLLKKRKQKNVAQEGE